MIEVNLAVASEAAFAADLDDFCTAHGWPSLQRPVLDDDQEPTGAMFLPTTVRTGSSRIDLHVFRLYVPVGESDGEPVMEDRGWHVNARLREADPRHPTGAHVAVAAAITAWFGQQQEADLGIPTDVQSAYQVADRKVRATARGSKLIDPAPAVPKIVWAA